MKQTLAGILLLILLATAYLYMPLQWRRHKDIERGTQLIGQVEAYRRQHHKLPETDAADTLKQLGFVKNAQGWQPGYRKLSSEHYQIRYADGYVAPYLTWRSDRPEWQLSSEQP